MALTHVQGWNAIGEHGLTKKFVFDDFKQASHFLQRYSKMCTKTGIDPEWSNVYNQVTVTINNEEFGSISTKEVEVAKYLDMLAKVRVTNFNFINDSHSFDQVLDRAHIDVKQHKNVQGQPTKLVGGQRHHDHLRLEA